MDPACLCASGLGHTVMLLPFLNTELEFALEHSMLEMCAGKIFFNSKADFLLQRLSMSVEMLRTLSGGPSKQADV